MFIIGQKGPEFVAKRVPGTSAIKETIELLDSVKKTIGKRSPLYRGRNDDDDLGEFCDWLDQQEAAFEGIYRTLEKDRETLLALGQMKQKD